LLLAAVGLYGVMAYAVGQRTHEIGIGIALGAQAREVRRLVMTDGAAGCAVGLLLRLGGALAGTRVVAGCLCGVGHDDSMTFAGAGPLLSAVALLANYVPARKASRIGPMMVIRR